jgi:hypothetical protein
MTEPTDPTIIELLKNVQSAMNADDLFIMTGALNLYLESMHRLANRSLVTPVDLEHILGIWYTYRLVNTIADPDVIPGAPTKSSAGRLQRVT